MPVTAPPLEPSPRPIEREFADFSGGMNTRDNPTAIDLNQLVLILNGRITQQKGLKRREGPEEYGTVVSADTTSDVIGEYQYFDNDDDMHELRVLSIAPDSAKLQELDGDGTWSDVTDGDFTSDNMPYFITFRGQKGDPVITDTVSTATEYGIQTTLTVTADENAGRVIKITAGKGVGQHRLILSNTDRNLELYERWDTIPDNTSTYQVFDVVDVCMIANGVDRPKMYEGIDGVVTVMSGLPRVRGFTVHKNKWLGWGGPDLDDDEFVWSTEGFGGDVPKYAHQEVYTNRGESIVRLLGEVGDQALLFKERSTKRLVGDTIESFSVLDVDGGIGCIAPFTAQTEGGVAYFLSHRGVEISDGQRIGFGREKLPISDPVSPNVIQWSNALRSSFIGQIFEQNYYIAVAKANTSTALDQIWVYDTGYAGWVVDEGYFPRCFTLRKDGDGIDQLAFGDSRGNGKSWLAEQQPSDGGADITFQVVTGKIKMTTIARNKNFEKGYYVWPATEDFETVVVDRQVDDNGWVNVDTFQLSNNPLILPFTIPGELGTTGIKTEPRFIIDQGHFLQTRFTNQGANESVILLAYTIIATDLSLP